MSMEKAQRMYDRQTPEDSQPDWPTDAEVDAWISGDGSEKLIEMWQEECQDGQGYIDFVGWTELHYDRVVELYIDNYEAPEPDDYTNKEMDDGTI